MSHYHHWNYGLTRETTPTGEHLYAVRELHYDAEGSVIAWAEEPLAPVGEDVLELITIADRFATAVQSPLAFDVDARAWVYVPRIEEDG